MTRTQSNATDIEPRGGEVTAAHTRVWQRFRSSGLAVTGLGFVLLLFLLAVFGPLIAPDPPNAQDLANRLSGPSAEHLLGTDEVGRDQLSRLIYGTRVSMLGAAQAVAIGVGVGVPFGTVAGFFGRWVDVALSFVTDAMMSVPALIFAMTVVAVLGRGLTNAMVAVGIILIPRFFRVARAPTINVRRETFIEASEAIGCTAPRILWRHVFPNVLSPILVQISVVAGIAVTAEASLSFIGLGVTPPTASWGSMLNSAYRTISEAPHMLYPPGVMIALTVLAFAAMGDGLRKALGTERVRGTEQL